MFTKIKTVAGKIGHWAKAKRFFACQLILVILTGTMIVTLNDSVKTVKIKDADTVLQVRTMQTDPYEILKLAGCPVGKHDLVLFSEENENVIEVNRAFSVRLTVDGTEQKVQAVAGQTVAEVLKKAGISLDQDDYVSPPLTTPLAENMQISVKKVNYSYSTVVKEMTTDHKVEYTYQTKTVGGKAEPTKEIAATPVAVSGSKNVISTLTPTAPIALYASGRPINYKKKITGKATAYCTGTTCSTGVKVRPGYIAVNPKQIPYGTKMYIVSSDGKYNYGYAIAADTGGFAKKGSAIADLYMTSYGDCIRFGRRNIDIYILD